MLLETERVSLSFKDRVSAQTLLYNGKEIPLMGGGSSDEERLPQELQEYENEVVGSGLIITGAAITLGTMIVWPHFARTDPEDPLLVPKLAVGIGLGAYLAIKGSDWGKNTKYPYNKF